MAADFDFIVVGKGMMGAAAARHLTVSGARVALIGPDEPKDWAAHDGVFASHYDNGRITRTIDGDRDWARLAQRSIARYRDIEAASGIPFFHDVGCLISGPVPAGDGGYLDGVAAVVDDLGLDVPLLTASELSARFPHFSVPGHAAGFLEASGAGHINPRAFVAAQAACFEKAGGTILSQEAVSTLVDGDSVTVALRDGSRVSAGRVLVAAGGFSGADGLLPRRPDLVVKGRTVIFAEVGEADLPAYAGMPCWIDESGDPKDHFYLLPPIRYPDGRWYIKIGGDPTDIVLNSDADIRAWFKTDGDPGAIAHLRRVLAAAMPGLTPRSWVSTPCVTTYTAHGYPYAGFVEGDRIALLAGGNGAAAKSSDEIGRLGARLVLDGALGDEGYATDFAVHLL